MKRFRWLNFYIDAQRNILKACRSESEMNDRLLEFSEMICFCYGKEKVEDKLQRWLKINPPTLCVPIEYHDLILEVQSSYIAGSFYPALASACCIGERILNHLIMGIKDEYVSSPYYKKIYKKSSLQDWYLAIEILESWQYLTPEIINSFKSLLELRNPSVHFGNVSEREESSLHALNLVYKITDYLFGMNHERFFWGPGEIYIKKAFENDALTKKFILPNCSLVGYKHKIQNINSIPTIIDHIYSNDTLSDEDFKQLRTNFKG